MTWIIVLAIAAVSSGALFVLMRWGEVAAAATDDELKK